MLDNGTHVAVLTSTYAWAANRTDLVQLPESNLCSVAYQDGYLIYAQRGTEKFWLSGLDDATTIGALDFSSADAFADNLVGCISDHRALYLFGRETVEGWYNNGDATFPFARDPSGFMERGCIATGSIAKAQSSVYWLGNDLCVYRASGFQPQVISTPAIDLLIAGASEPSSAEAFVYSLAGHTYYVLNFGDLTLRYDITTGMWSERSSADLERWRVASYANLEGLHLVGDVETTDIYELDPDTYDEDGDEIVRDIVCPPLSAGARVATLDEIFLDIEAGQGLATGQGSDPAVMLDWSDDDGRTWVGGLTASAGLVGEYRRRVTFLQLGQFVNRTLRFRFSDPVRWTILGAQARIGGGM